MLYYVIFIAIIFHHLFSVLLVLVGRLGFDETRSKKFRLSFEMHGSPTDNLLRDCSYRMLRIRHLYQILTEIGLPNLAEAYLKDYGNVN